MWPLNAISLLAFPVTGSIHPLHSTLSAVHLVNDACPSQPLASVYRPNIIRCLTVDFSLVFQLRRGSLILRVGLECFGFKSSGQSVRVCFDGGDIFVARLEELGL